MNARNATFFKVCRRAAHALATSARTLRRSARQIATRLLSDLRVEHAQSLLHGNELISKRSPRKSVTPTAQRCEHFCGTIGTGSARSRADLR